MIGSRHNGIGLVIVVLVMCAVILGAYAAQYYSRTAPVRVKPVTVTVTLNEENEAGAVWNGTENFSNSGDTITLPQSTEENYRVNFWVDNSSGNDLTLICADLSVKISWQSEENTANLVDDGSDQGAVTMTLNGPDGLGYAPGTSGTPTIEIYENTENVSSETLKNFEIRIHLTEA